jgi:hypothetical protein
MKRGVSCAADGGNGRSYVQPPQETSSMQSETPSTQQSARPNPRTGMNFFKIAALEAELGLPPADLRLDKAQRAYATRLFTLPPNHPVLQICPDTFPKTLDNEKEHPTKFNHWYEQDAFKPKYESRLTKILSHINNIIQPPSIIEDINVIAAAPWDQTSFLDIHIPEGPKDIVAQKHKDRHKRQPHP